MMATHILIMSDGRRIPCQMIGITMPGIPEFHYDAPIIDQTYSVTVPGRRSRWRSIGATGMRDALR